MKTKYSKSICRKLFSAPEEFVQWLYNSYKENTLSKHSDYEKFTKILAEEIFQHCLPIKNKIEKKEFLSAYSYCDDRNGFIIADILSKYNTSCIDLKCKVSNLISEKLKLIGKILADNNSVSHDELTSITYMLRHNLLDKRIENSLGSAAKNIAYLKENFNIENISDWDDYENNFKNKFDDSKEGMLAYKANKALN